jgi:hypothetical protein
MNEMEQNGQSEQLCPLGRLGSNEDEGVGVSCSDAMVDDAATNCLVTEW